MCVTRRNKQTTLNKQTTRIMRRTNTSESLGGIVIYSGVRVALLLLLSCGILRTRLVSSRCHGAFVAVPTGQHNHRHCLAQQNPPPMVETRFSGSPPTKRHQRALGNNNNIGGRCFMLNNNYLSSLTTGSSSANPRENSDAPNRAVVVSPKPNTAPWKPNASAAAVPLASPALASYQTGSYLDNLVGVPPLHSDASSSSASFQNDSNARNTYNSNNDSNRNEAPLQQQQRGSSLPPQSSSYLDSLKSSRGPERSQQQPPPPFGRATPATSGITRPPPWRPPSNSEQQQSSAASSSSSWVSYGDPTTSQQQQYSASTSRTPPAWIQPLGQLLNQQQQQPPMSEASPLGNDGGPSNDSGSAPPTFAYQNPMRQQQQQVSSSSAASSPWNSSPMFKQQQGSEQQTSQSSSSSNRPAPWSPYQNNSNIELQNIVNNESRNSVGPTSSFPSTTSGGVDTGSSSNSRPAPWTPRKDMGATPPPQSTWVSYGTPTTTTNPTAATSALQQNPVFDKDAPRIAAWQQSSLTDCVASRPEKPWKPLPFSNAEERPAAWSPPQKKVDRPSPWSPRKNDNAGSPSTTPSWTGSNSIFATSNTNPSSETDGVAIPYSSFSDSMESTEDEVDERTAAEILAEKMRAASLDVEILEQQITTDDSYHNKLRENNEYETEGSFYFDNQRNVTGNAPINFNDWENEIGSGLPPLNDTTTPLASKFFDQRRPVNDTFRSSPKNMPIKENRDFRTKQMPDRPVTSFTPNGPPQPPIRVQQKQKIPAMQETSFHGVGGDSKRSMGGSVKEGKAAVRDEHYMRMAMRLAMSSGYVNFSFSFIGHGRPFLLNTFIAHLVLSYRVADVTILCVYPVRSLRSQIQMSVQFWWRKTEQF